jgi:hypothetical protein
MKAKPGSGCAVETKVIGQYSLATALGLACAVWTEDTDFFGTGVGVWTTNRIEISLEGQAQSLESQDE